jgi:hypothetical protein
MHAHKPLADNFDTTHAHMLAEDGAAVHAVAVSKRAATAQYDQAKIARTLWVGGVAAADADDESLRRTLGRGAAGAAGAVQKTYVRRKAARGDSCKSWALVLFRSAEGAAAAAARLQRIGRGGHRTSGWRLTKFYPCAFIRGWV